MIFYSMFYNVSQQPNIFLERMDTPLGKDNNLLSLKMALDNAILQIKAKEKGLEEIPEIEISF